MQALYRQPSDSLGESFQEPQGEFAKLLRQGSLLGGLRHLGLRGFIEFRISRVSAVSRVSGLVSRLQSRFSMCPFLRGDVQADSHRLAMRPDRKA